MDGVPKGTADLAARWKYVATAGTAGTAAIGLGTALVMAHRKQALERFIPYQTLIANSNGPLEFITIGPANCHRPSYVFRIAGSQQLRMCPHVNWGLGYLTLLSGDHNAPQKCISHTQPGSQPGASREPAGTHAAGEEPVGEPISRESRTKRNTFVSNYVMTLVFDLVSTRPRREQYEINLCTVPNDNEIYIIGKLLAHQNSMPAGDGSRLVKTTLLDSEKATWNIIWEPNQNAYSGDELSHDFNKDVIGCVQWLSKALTHSKREVQIIKAGGISLHVSGLLCYTADQIKLAAQTGTNKKYHPLDTYFLASTQWTFDIHRLAADMAKPVGSLMTQIIERAHALRPYAKSQGGRQKAWWLETTPQLFTIHSASSIVEHYIASDDETSSYHSLSSSSGEELPNNNSVT